MKKWLLLAGCIIFSTPSYALYTHPEVNRDIRKIVHKHYPHMMFSYAMKYCLVKQPHLKLKIKRAENLFLLNLSITMTHLQQEGLVNEAYLEYYLSELNRTPAKELQQRLTQQVANLENQQGSQQFCPSLVNYMLSLDEQTMRPMFASIMNIPLTPHKDVAQPSNPTSIK